MKSEFILEAISLAKQAAAAGEVPVGAVVVKDGKIIGSGRNRTEEMGCQLGHAELIAIKNAAETLGDWRLDGCEIYITLEPCPMCAGAIINSRIKTVVFGAYDLNFGAADSVVNLFSAKFPSTPEVLGGIHEEECKKILKDFFEERRK